MGTRYIIKATEGSDEDGKANGFASAPYSKFMPRHPEYDPEYWEQLEALCNGGKDLLGNRKLMERIFPKHRAEHEVIYAERLKCAHYIPFAAEIVANTVMGVMSDPLEVNAAGEGDVPQFYGDFTNDCSRKGKKTKCTLQSFVGEALITALVKRRAWAQADLPRVEGEFRDALEEKNAGALDAYLVSIAPENVLDWEEDEDGDLTWAMTRKVSRRRTSPDDDRKKITEEFTVFDRDGFQVFEIHYSEDKPPEPKDPVRLVDEGGHSFGQVPLCRLTMPDNLWSMDKMEPACRALLRDLNSLEWAVRQSLHAELYEFLGAEGGGMMNKVGDNQTDAQRALNQTRGQGHVQARGADDRAEYIGPPTEGFEFALKLVEMHRDEMHRVNNQSGVNTDVTASSKQQSAEAKREERNSAESLYREIGRYIREFTESILQVVADGRKDSEATDGIVVSGCTTFSKRTTDGHLENALLVQSMAIESPTLDRKLKLDVVKVHLGDVLSDEDIDIIEGELNDNIVDESYDPTLPSPEEIAMENALEAAGKGSKTGDDESTWAEDDED